MPHSAVGSLVSASSAPSISSEDSELSFEDVTTMETATALDDSPNVGPKQHPTLFCDDGMVTIEVQNVLFRRPSYFFTQRSDHFAKCLKGVANLAILDDDVTSDAFANLVRVLHPPLGIIPITDLAGWTDVLHLSSKWNFQDLRAAAIKAIQPLASCIDMIALARTYDITDWLPDAFEKVLARKDDLTVQEARRIPLEDVIAIAKGRLQARSHDLKPQDEVQAVAWDILGLAPINISPASSDAPPPPALRAFTTPPKAKPTSSTSDHGKGSPEEHEMVARWFAQQGNPSSMHAAEECLTEYARTRAWSRPLILEHFVMRGLQDFICAYDQDPTSFIRLASTNVAWQYPPKLLSDSSSIRFLRSLAPDDYVWIPDNRAFPITEIRKACLKAVGGWKSIGQYPCDDTSHRNSIVVRSRYVDYLVTNGLITDDVYRDFWQSMALLFKDQYISPKNIELARNLVTELGACTCVLKASFEMDSLYKIAESAIDAAQEAGLDELKISLETFIRKRRWPVPLPSKKNPSRVVCWPAQN